MVGANLLCITVQHIPFILVICNIMGGPEASLSAALAGNVQACCLGSTSQTDAHKTSVSK